MAKRLAAMLVVASAVLCAVSAYAGKASVEEADYSPSRLQMWSPKKISRAPFGPPSRDKESAASQYNKAVMLGAISKFVGREVTHKESVTESDVETLVVPAGTIASRMAGMQGEDESAEVIYRGPFRFAEATTTYVVRKWGVPVGMIPTCSNPWTGVIPDAPMQGKDGAPGPKGDKGDMGRTGQKGDKGDMGAKGQGCKILGIGCGTAIGAVVVGAVTAVMCATHTGICKEDKARDCASGHCLVEPVYSGFHISLGARF